MFITRIEINVVMSLLILTNRMNLMMINLMTMNFTPRFYAFRIARLRSEAVEMEGGAPHTASRAHRIELSDV